MYQTPSLASGCTAIQPCICNNHEQGGMIGAQLWRRDLLTRQSLATSPMNPNMIITKSATAAFKPCSRRHAPGDQSSIKEGQRGDLMRGDPMAGTHKGPLEVGEEVHHHHHDGRGKRPHEVAHRIVPARAAALGSQSARTHRAPAGGAQCCKSQVSARCYCSGPGSYSWPQHSPVNIGALPLQCWYAVIAEIEAT
jgi:hypothetical protein